MKIKSTVEYDSIIDSKRVVSSQVKNVAFFAPWLQQLFHIYFGVQPVPDRIVFEWDNPYVRYTYELVKDD